MQIFHKNFCDFLCENQPLWIEVSTNLGKRTFQF
ncbi:hypothetical protein HPSNT_04235 [Helicobacter pylori SNT49]|uniref:Uncharacterized protein n=1 Tax=Helicobacter pylori SNT49 TaxID=1055530 RepID=G2MC42_HELPX|nr:hypothetical protein HPSNT_04235 [Helicobacter pylori SNT49]EPZ96329.1 hypothetical protein N205_05820 [Helicobacter pylori UM077]EQK96982.1 hypothetical protein N201_04850 [Helicobacter pylori UM066]ERM21558.1 hypothetical protein H500_02475 [Helicobacter pylori CG-IMSS-2012]